MDTLFPTNHMVPLGAKATIQIQCRYTADQVEVFSVDGELYAFQGYRFLLHRSTETAARGVGPWAVSHAVSGLRAATGASKKEALENASVRMQNRVQHGDFHAILENATRQMDLYRKQVWEAAEALLRIREKEAQAKDDLINNAPGRAKKTKAPAVEALVAPQAAPQSDTDRVAALLTDTPACVDELALAAGLKLSETLAALTMLELAGRATQMPGKRFVGR